MHALNLGILAHVDAGKTTLTERLLFAAGVIDQIGSVDAGTTQTDSLELERRRGITIRSAVVSFPLDGVQVNLIDTPGHPDFIAEVERVLSVLDGAVLVLSAVEGVQAQTRVLLRALRRLRVPTLLFVNKIDRRGAGYGEVLAAIADRLTGVAVAMGSVERLGTPAATFTPSGPDDPGFRNALTEVLAGQDDELLAAYVAGRAGLPYRRLRAALATQTRQVLAHPVYFGSAVTGAGVRELLPATAGDAGAPVSGRVFTIERGSADEKVAYVRLFAGTIRTRDRLRLPGGAEGKVTAAGAVEAGGQLRRGTVRAGEIGKLWGLDAVRVGDAVGVPPAIAVAEQFAPPLLSATVVPRRPEQAGALRSALARLAEQDPLINVRASGQVVTVSLYGEVQKEVLQATLAGEFGLDVAFRETATICVERPTGSGEAVEVLNTEHNPFWATIGLRVDAAPPGSGVEFRLRVEARSVPLYVYRSMDRFAGYMEQYVRRSLAEGCHGWQVTDCLVTMIRCGYSSADGPPATRGPLSTAADYRDLTPMVLMRALERARTVVCEPVLRASLEIPATAIGPVVSAVARLGATATAPQRQGALATIEAPLPASRLPELARQLAGLTGGEGTLEYRLTGYQPVRGDPPVRPRTTADPRRRDEYLAWLAHRR
jgi:ribosomal protection tetracycline resistance protein